MDNTLDASLFASSPEIYETEFKNILTKITTCYQMMVKDKVRVPNNENKIRDILYNNYLNNNTIRAILKLTYYIFDCEVAEYDKDGNAIGFLDYKISTQNTFIESNSYYSIECKRLDDQNITMESSAEETPNTSAENNLPNVNKTDFLTDVLAVDNNIYRMENHRRMRSKVLHYIDHPLVGILVQINTVIKPEKEL